MPKIISVPFPDVLENYWWMSELAEEYGWANVMQKQKDLQMRSSAQVSVKILENDTIFVYTCKNTKGVNNANME